MPEMKEAYYFSHDANARHDDKILELRAEYGWEGYGLFWALIETLRDCSNYSFPSNATAGLALSLSIDKTKLQQFISKCVDLGLFVEDDGVFYSESLMRRMEEIDEKRRKRAEAGRKGGNAKAMLKQRSGNALAKSSKEKKEKESKEEHSNGAPAPKELSFLEMFDACQKIYPGTKRGTDTEFTDFQKKHGKLFNIEFFRALYVGIERKNKTNKSLAAAGAFVPEWPHFKTYLNQRRWEEETTVPAAPEPFREPRAFNSLEERIDFWGGRNPNFNPEAA